MMHYGIIIFFQNTQLVLGVHNIFMLHLKFPLFFLSSLANAAFLARSRLSVKSSALFEEAPDDREKSFALPSGADEDPSIFP